MYVLFFQVIRTRLLFANYQFQVIWQRFELIYHSPKVFAQELTYFPMHNCTWKCQFARLRAVECHYPVYYVHIIKRNSCESATDIEKCINSRQYLHRFHTVNSNRRAHLFIFTLCAAASISWQSNIACSLKYAYRKLKCIKIQPTKMNMTFI